MGLKLVSGLVGSFISWMVGGLGLAFVVLLALMLFDFLTGLAVGYVTKELKSSVGIKGLVKKTYVVILIGSVYLIQSSVPMLKSMDIIGDGVVVAYIIVEFLSIVENGGKLGVPLGPIAKVIAVLKGNGDGK